MATSSNPAFNERIFAGYEQVYGGSRADVMTVQGTVSKTFLLLGILSATAIWSWMAASQGQLQPVIVPAAMFGGFLMAMVICFKPTLAAWLAPVYAAFEGVFLGALSYWIETHVKGAAAHPGIALQAVSMTLGTLLVMLFLYSSRIIQVTDRLRTGIIAATGALALVYLVSFALTMVGVQVPFLRDSSPLGIGISVAVVGLAAFNLLLDFDFIERSAAYGAPRSMEWYGAFGLMVTLVWLYLEILRLLRQLQDRR